VEVLRRERGVSVDHATANRWMLKDRSPLAVAYHRRQRPVWVSWKIDGAYIKVKRRWYDRYHAVDQSDQTIAVLLTAQRDERATTRFLTKAIRLHGVPETIRASPEKTRNFVR